MDENNVVATQPVANPREGCLALMNKLLATLTVFEREVKMAHWNYMATDFVSIHPWLDTVHDDVCECIDDIAEEIRKGLFFPQGTLQECLTNSEIKPTIMPGPCTKEMTFAMLVVDLSKIRELADALSTMADENKFWTIQDLANGILSKMNHHMYFVKNTVNTSKNDDDDEDDD